MPRLTLPTPVLAILSCSLLLSAPALINGYHLVFSDSGTYLEQAIALRGSTLRAPYYSLFLFPIHLRFLFGRSYSFKEYALQFSFILL